ncbi:MAG TPA: hypothetical protein VKG25_28495 [Bryobacteraceae bacterium]|nr:hypothetical protein [Bryobacteraceae bacterium]
MTCVRARNTAPYSENKIHDDVVAASYGFQGGLVPGVTVYGYLASVVVRELSPEWMQSGSMSVRLQAPFYDGDPVRIETQKVGDDLRLLAEREASAVCATGLARIREPILEWADFAEAPMPPFESRPDAAWGLFEPGKPLGTLRDRLDLNDGEYLERHCFDAVAETLPLYRTTAHPAVLLAMANLILVSNYRLGPWIHASSELTNFGAAAHGDEVCVRGRVHDRFERKGHEFVVLDLAMTKSTGERLLRARHTAIYRPRTNS